MLRKKMGAMVLAFLMVLPCLVLPAGAAAAVSVTIDGTLVPFDNNYGHPFLDSAGRTQVPFRLTMETFGCSVEWEQSTQTAVAKKTAPGLRFPSAGLICW